MNDLNELWNDEVSNEICSQLIKICGHVGLDADLFDTDDAQEWCMVKMSTAIADKLEARANQTLDTDKLKEFIELKSPIYTDNSDGMLVDVRDPVCAWELLAHLNT